MAHEDRSTLEEIFERPAVGPLAGVVVADLSRVLAGPYCTMLLADLGALVIKVESPGGDDTRRWSPPRRGDDSTYYLSVNRNKYSIALDFKDPADLAVVRRIVDRAMQMCGALGVSDDLPLARLSREVRPFRIYDGASEVHRWSIAKRAVHRATAS